MKIHILYLDHHGTEKILCRFPTNFRLPKNYKYVKIWLLYERFTNNNITTFKEYVKSQNICLKCANKFIKENYYSF